MGNVPSVEVTRKSTKDTLCVYVTVHVHVYNYVYGYYVYM